MSEFQIEKEEDGTVHASDGIRSITVEPGKREVKYFHRNNITKSMGNGGTQRGRIFVADLDGVRLYIKGDKMIMTRRDLYFQGE